MTETREELAPYLDRRIGLTGVYDKATDFPIKGVRTRTVLLQDCEAQVSGQVIDVGHLWVQYAENFDAIDLRHGQRVRLEARVISYRKSRMGVGEDCSYYNTCYGLAYPTAIQVVGLPRPMPAKRVVNLAEPPPAPEAPGVAPASTGLKGTELAVRLKGLVHEAGGAERVAKALDWLREADNL
jgi:hypothetical protein